MVYLRARYYAPTDGRFLSRDTWEGDANKPMSYNAWLYTYANPVNLTDSSGKFAEEDIMLFMGVNTWADVIKQFIPGGRFGGNWGWLEVMRQAETGDIFYAVNLPRKNGQPVKGSI
jgi:uncharacterized protein RhaS with RHS repeats